MPKTSASQFELMVDFMERNGNLSKPTEGPTGRLSNIQHWAELTNILNADATGDTKTYDKWRKVWSDLKNNTKRKAARIHRAASGTGGEPAIKLKLSEFEERVLNIIGTQAATGIAQVVEIGLYNARENMLEVIGPATSPLPADQHAPEEQHSNPQPGSSTQSQPFVEFGEITLEPANFCVPLPGTSPTLPHIQPVEVSPRQRRRLSMTRQGSPPPIHPLAESVRVTPRRRRRIIQRLNATSPTLNRARHTTQSEISRQLFLNIVIVSGATF